MTRIMFRLGAVTVRLDWCARLLTAAVCGVVLMTAAPAWAQTSDDELGRRHFESGVAYLQESDYENALKAFEKAYALSKRPAILLNIATVHERKGDLKAAIEALKRYLEVAPNSEEAQSVKNRIANLEKRLEASPPPAETPPPAATPPPTTTSAPASTPTPPPTAPAPSPAAESTPPNRIPAYIALSIGGLSAAGAVLTGILAQSEYGNAEDECKPNCSDDQLSTGRTMAVTSTILTGVAVVGVGIGAALLFTGGSEPEPVPAAGVPRVFAGAQASWSF
jgi:tetratricopeptide (TPR) repeat protein